jgi:hypothetical protein
MNEPATAADSSAIAEIVDQAYRPYIDRTGTLPRPCTLVEILATFADRSDKLAEERYREWARTTLHGFDGPSWWISGPSRLAKQTMC